MNAQQQSLQSATKLINDNPAIFNKFYDRELRLNTIAAAMLQFSIDMDKSYIEERDNHVPDIFEDIFKSFNFSL